MKKIQRLSFLVILVCLFLESNSYIQLSLSKRIAKTKAPKQLNCTQDKKNKNDKSIKTYEQFCYQKDISYFIQLFYNSQNYQISMDITSPISWLKGQQCKVIDSNHQKCEILNPTLKEKIQNKILQRKSYKKSHIQKQKQSISKLQQQQSNVDEPQQTSQSSKMLVANIHGSNQVVSGYLQQNHNVQFWTKDSGRLSRLADILMVGFYFLQQKQKIMLKNSNFINATKLTNNINSLSDGSLSLRFDQGSQKSVLAQIFEYAQTDEKIITIYLSEKQNILTIGQFSIKNSDQGYSGIKWIPLAKDQTKYGILPIVTSVMIEDLNTNKDEQIEQSLQLFGVLSLSASYIGLPQTVINQLIKNFSLQQKSKCSVNQKQHLQCEFSSKEHAKLFKQKDIVFSFGDVSISIKTNQLIIFESKKKIILNVKRIIQDQYLILGEPIFLKYFTVLDYKKNKIGFSLKKMVNQNKIINVVTLIRFVSFIFFLGCSILLCFRPIQKMINVFKGKQSFRKKSAQGRRLNYSKQQNNYDEVNQKLKQALEQQQN